MRRACVALSCKSLIFRSATFRVAHIVSHCFPKIPPRVAHPLYTSYIDAGALLSAAPASFLAEALR